jgi:predicted metal-dependent hydrolase
MFEIERFLLGHLETLQHWRSQRFAVEHHATLNHLKLCVSQCHCTDGLRVTLSDDMIESLRHSLKKQAKTILSERLRLWSETMNTGYSSLRLGFPKSRWGSCSSSGTISLSCMLVSVDQPLQDYVIIHELSHVQHMHHRQSFWQHVERYDPNYKLHRSKLKNLRSHI